MTPFLEGNESVYQPNVLLCVSCNDKNRRCLGTAPRLWGAHLSSPKGEGWVGVSFTVYSFSPIHYFIQALSFFVPFSTCFFFLLLSLVFLSYSLCASTESHLFASYYFALNLLINTLIDFLPLPLPSFLLTLFQNWVIGPSTVSSSVLAILCSVFFFQCFIFYLSSLVVLPTLSVWHSECFPVSLSLLPCIFFLPFLLPLSPPPPLSFTLLYLRFRSFRVDKSSGKDKEETHEVYFIVVELFVYHWRAGESRISCIHTVLIWCKKKRHWQTWGTNFMMSGWANFTRTGSEAPKFNT